MAPDCDAPAVGRKVQHFLDAAGTGNLDLLKKLASQLDDGSGVSRSVADFKDEKQRGALHLAAGEGKTEVCKYLLEELKLDIDTKDEGGDTPLIHAARQGHTEAVKYLIDRGADPAIPGNKGATALHYSAGLGNIEVLKFLLSRGADVESQSDGGSPLIWAAVHRQPDVMKILLEHKANPNAESDDRITPLFISVAVGSLPCLELLLKAGANVNIMAGAASPLHVAAYNGSLEIINCLLKAEADPNILDEEDHWKPIMVAADRGHRESVEALLPVTSWVESVPKWTVDGIIEYMQLVPRK